MVATRGRRNENRRSDGGRMGGVAMSAAESLRLKSDFALTVRASLKKETAKEPLKAEPADGISPMGEILLEKLRLIASASRLASANHRRECLRLAGPLLRRRR